MGGIVVAIRLPGAVNQELPGSDVGPRDETAYWAEPRCWSEFPNLPSLRDVLRHQFDQDSRNHVEFNN